ncbi:hypothetical protein GW17_00012565 [Ensete ventricosum]|nr:hypothetical protein GW17_00012565 [Ensete ventricosum]
MQYDMKLLAVDIPMASGPDQRLFLAGNEQEYRVGGGLISELRDPIVKAMAAEKEFEDLDQKEEEEDEIREREEAERKQREEEQRALEAEKQQHEEEERTVDAADTKHRTISSQNPIPKCRGIKSVSPEIIQREREREALFVSSRLVQEQEEEEFEAASPKVLLPVVGKVGKAGVVHVEEPHVLAVVSRDDAVEVSRDAFDHGVDVALVLTSDHIALDVADALRRHRTPAAGVVGLHGGHPARAVARFHRHVGARAWLHGGGAAEVGGSGKWGSLHEAPLNEHGG